VVGIGEKRWYKVKVIASFNRKDFPVRLHLLVHPLDLEKEIKDFRDNPRLDRLELINELSENFEKRKPEFLHDLPEHIKNMYVGQKNILNKIKEELNLIWLDFINKESTNFTPSNKNELLSRIHSIEIKNERLFVEKQGKIKYQSPHGTKEIFHALMYIIYLLTEAQPDETKFEDKIEKLIKEYDFEAKTKSEYYMPKYRSLDYIVKALQASKSVLKGYEIERIKREFGIDKNE